MRNRILVFYGAYRSDRMGIRLAQFVVERLRRRGDDVELIDAKAINLPMLDRMYKEYPKGEARAERLNSRSRALLTISCGGWKQRKRSDNASIIHFSPAPTQFSSLAC